LSAAIAVVVVTHDSAGELDDLLAGLDRALGEEDEIIFVDSASRDGRSRGSASACPRPG